MTFEELEIIIVDDGSDDGAENICHEYAAKDGRIKYYRIEHCGVSMARNFGIEKAQGEFIYFMDSDYTVNEVFIEAAYKKAVENDSDMVFIDWIFFNFNIPIEEISVTGTCGLFYRKSFIDNHPELRFNEEVGFNEDGLFTVMALSLSDKKSLSLNSVYSYNLRSNSILIAVSDEEIYQSICVILRVLKQFLQNYQHNIRFVKNIRNFIWNNLLNWLFLNKVRKLSVKRKIYYEIKRFYEEEIAAYLPYGSDEFQNYMFKRFVKSTNFFSFMLKSGFMSHPLIHNLYMIYKGQNC